MFIPAQYKNENLEEVKKFIEENSFGILVNTVDDKPWATHIPLELDVDTEGKEVLVGHIAYFRFKALSIILFPISENLLPDAVKGLCSSPNQSIGV